MCISLAAVTLLLNFVGVFEYIIIGPDAASIITENLPDAPLTTCITVAFMAALTISFPLQVRTAIQITNERLDT